MPRAWWGRRSWRGRNCRDDHLCLRPRRRQLIALTQKQEAVMLQGKGMSIWRIAACEGGNAQAMVKRATAVGLRHVHIKVADGVSQSNQPGQNTLAEVVAALKGAGLEVWGWHFLYGTKGGQVVAAQEADRAIQQIKTLGL